MEGVVCVTAQHRDMLDQALRLFELVPDHDLDLMRPGQDLHALTARVLTGLRPVLLDVKPDVVLVHGDTTTTLAATLAAFYLQIPVGHVEAGLRTGDLSAPFPEEANRVLADKLCAFHFAPTAGSAQRLLDEGMPPARVYTTGNTVIDALLWVRERVAQARLEDLPGLGPIAHLMNQPDVPMLLITGHRRESFGEGFRNICAALRTLALRHPQLQLVYPVHMNPNVQQPVRETLEGLPNVHLLSPLDYAPFVRLMDRSTLILTDSGEWVPAKGAEEEAPALAPGQKGARRAAGRAVGRAGGEASGGWREGLHSGPKFALNLPKSAPLPSIEIPPSASSLSLTSILSLTLTLTLHFNFMI